MICPNCQHQQNDYLFCTQCGTPLAAEERNTNIVEYTPAEAPKPEAGSIFMQEERGKRKPLQKTMLGSALAALLATAAAVAMAACAGYLARSSALVQDYTFSFYTRVLNLKQADAYHILSQRLPGIWDMLVLEHGGTWRGTIEQMRGAEKEVLAGFTLHLPVMSLSVLLLLLFIFLFRIADKGLERISISKPWFLLGGGVLYALILTSCAYLLSPSLEWGSRKDAGTSHAIHLAADYPELALKSFVVYLAAGFIGLRFPRKGSASSRWIWLTIIYDLRRFYATALGFILLVGALMVGVWAASDPVSFYSSSYSMAVVWQEYKDDAAFYFLFPTVLFQELLFALGGVWHIEGRQLSELIQLSPASIGIWDRGLEADIRWTWHPYALLTVILYSLSRARVGERWSSVVMLTAGLGLSVYVLALWTKVSYTTASGNEQWIGFSAGQVTIYAIIAGLIYFSVSYLITLWIRHKGAGERNEA